MKDLIKTVPMDPELKDIQSVGRLNRPGGEVEIKVIGPELDIYGREDDFKEIPESEFAEDETYALRGDGLMQNLEQSMANACTPRLTMMSSKEGVYESFHPLPNATVKRFKEGNIPEIKGVVLKGGKGVVVQVIPDDQLPTDTEGGIAELLAPERRLPGLGGDHDYDMLHTFPSHAVIPVYAKPKTHINRQRQGYSRRKAKRAFQARAVHRVKLTRYRRRHTGYLLLLDENGNFVSPQSDIHISQTFAKKLNTDVEHPGNAEMGGFMQPTKPSPVGKGDING